MDDRQRAGVRLPMQSYTENDAWFRRREGAGGKPPFVADPDLPVPPPIPRGRVHHGDLAMRIDGEGTWHYRGTPIVRPALVRLFASALTRDAAGAYWLVTPAEMGRIQVDDAPFIAVTMTRQGFRQRQSLRFRTNMDDEVVAGPDNPIRVDTNPRTGEPSPYVTVRSRMEARIARPVYYDLVSLGTEERVDDEPVFGVWSGGAFFVLGRLDSAGGEVAP